jgi:PKD repeat protein
MPFGCATTPAHERRARRLDPATDQDGAQPVYADSLRNTLSWQGNYMDAKFGPDGALYVQVYDGFFRANPNVGVYRFDYSGGPDTPDPDPKATPAGGTKVAFAIGKSGGVSYRWDFGDGSSSTAATTNHNYRTAGTYDVTLTVTYADGERASKTIQVTVP